MNKLMWKQYLLSLNDSFNQTSKKFPSIEKINTYCFKLIKVFENELIICPEIGLIDIIEKKFFNIYRITALNIQANNAECITSKYPIFKINDTYKNGDINMYYYPNYPKLDIPKFNTNSIFYIIRAPIINICIHYEIIPLYPNLTIPTINTYTNIDDFKKEYDLMNKNIYIPNNNILNNDIIQEYNGPININEFLLFLINYEQH
jgi:hypothetical protein